MSNYIARVELHKATADDYENLHVAMQRRGYSRTITSNESVVYWLPTGTYDATGSATLNVALEAAKAAATETGKSSSIIVAERSAASWSGLEKKG